MDMDRLALDNGTANHRTAINAVVPSRKHRNRAVSALPIGACFLRRDGSQRHWRSHTPRGVLSNGIQHRLNISRRTGDDAENLTRRCLLLQCFLEFLEQPHVLDGDDRLVGEGFEKPNLLFSERFHFCTPDENRSDGNTFSEKWCAEHGAAPITGGTRFREWKFLVQVCLYIVNMDEPSVDHGSTGDRMTVYWRICFIYGSGNQSIVRGIAENIAI